MHLFDGLAVIPAAFTAVRAECKLFKGRKRKFEETRRRRDDKRYNLFSRFDEGIQMDEDMWWSVTPELMAKQMALRCSCPVVLDAFGGVGGNSIQFTETCGFVITAEISPERVRMAETNVNVYGSAAAAKVDFIIGDFKVLAQRQFRPDSFDGVFLAPPWGGVSYSASAVMNLRRLGNGLDFYDIIRDAQRLAPNLGLFLPRTSSVYELAQAGREFNDRESRRNRSSGSTRQKLAGPSINHVYSMESRDVSSKKDQSVDLYQMRRINDAPCRTAFVELHVNRNEIARDMLTVLYRPMEDDVEAVAQKLGNLLEKATGIICTPRHVLFDSDSDSLSTKGGDSDACNENIARIGAVVSNNKRQRLNSSVPAACGVTDSLLITTNNERSRQDYFKSVRLLVGNQLQKDASPNLCTDSTFADAQKGSTCANSKETPHKNTESTTDLGRTGLQIRDAKGTYGGSCNESKTTDTLFHYRKYSWLNEDEIEADWRVLPVDFIPQIYFLIDDVPEDPLMIIDNWMRNFYRSTNDSDVSEENFTVKVNDCDKLISQNNSMNPFSHCVCETILPWRWKTVGCTVLYGGFADRSFQATCVEKAVNRRRTEAPYTTKNGDVGCTSHGSRTSVINDSSACDDGCNIVSVARDGDDSRAPAPTSNIKDARMGDRMMTVRQSIETALLGLVDDVLILYGIVPDTERCELSMKKSLTSSVSSVNVKSDAQSLRDTETGYIACSEVSVGVTTTAAEDYGEDCRSASPFHRALDHSMHEHWKYHVGDTNKDDILRFEDTTKNQQPIGVVRIPDRTDTDTDRIPQRNAFYWMSPAVLSRRAESREEPQHCIKKTTTTCEKYASLESLKDRWDEWVLQVATTAVQYLVRGRTLSKSGTSWSQQDSPRAGGSITVSSFSLPTGCKNAPAAEGDCTRTNEVHQSVDTRKMNVNDWDECALITRWFLHCVLAAACALWITVRVCSPVPNRRNKRKKKTDHWRIGCESRDAWDFVVHAGNVFNRCLSCLRRNASIDGVQTSDGECTALQSYGDKSEHYWTMACSFVKNLYTEFYINRTVFELRGEICGLNAP